MFDGNIPLSLTPFASNHSKSFEFCPVDEHIPGVSVGCMETGINNLEYGVDRLSSFRASNCALKSENLPSFYVALDLATCL